MSTYDGPTLRAIRESMGVPLRRVARQAGMSHGHLSKVERGEHGRPITPAILAAYERVTGVSLADAAVAVAEQRAGVVGRRGLVWRPGQLSDLRRLAFNAAVGAIAIGGQLGEPVTRLLDSTGRPVVPASPTLPEAAQLEQVAGLLTSLDLRFGGELAGQLAKPVLRWAAEMLDEVSAADEAGRRLYAAVGAITARGAWAAFDSGAHESARSLFRLALFTAVRSHDVNLRAHLLADAAAQHNQLGYHEDALELVRLVEGDERVAAPVRMVLHGVKARAYAAAGMAVDCRRHIALAEQAVAVTEWQPAPSWVSSIGQPAHLAAATGHAVAVLARASGKPADLADASRRLEQAVDGFDPQVHSRARALCLARLATVQLTAGELDAGEHWARAALSVGAGIRSTRLTHALSAIRAAASAHPATPAMRQLAADLSVADGDQRDVDGDGGPPRADVGGEVPRDRAPVE